MKKKANLQKLHLQAFKKAGQIYSKTYDQTYQALIEKKLPFTDRFFFCRIYFDNINFNIYSRSKTIMTFQQKKIIYILPNDCQGVNFKIIKNELLTLKIMK